MLLSLSSLITRDIFIIKTSYYYRTKLLVHRTQWCKNKNFEKCAIMPGFCKSGHILGIIHGRKSSRILWIWKHLQMYSCTFYLGRNFYIWDCLNCQSFLVNYGKEGNSQNFSSADDSRDTVLVIFIMLYVYERIQIMYTYM